MKKIVRIIFLLLGIIFPILIGGLHTYTHFSQLIHPEVANKLTAEIMINGQAQTLWHTWGIMSFMMGIAFIVIGLLNAVIFTHMPKTAYPPKGALLAMLLYLGCVIYAGHEFEQMPQFIGGIVGFVLLASSLLVTWSAEKSIIK